MRRQAAGMFTVTEADAEAICDTFNREGELPAVNELRRRFAGSTDNAKAREFAIAGWTPLPAAPASAIPLRSRRTAKRGETAICVSTYTTGLSWRGIAIQILAVNALLRECYPTAAWLRHLAVLTTFLRFGRQAQSQPVSIDRWHAVGSERMHDGTSGRLIDARRLA